MSSINNKKNQAFTFEDFEKGLMLSGHLSPENEQEVYERELINDYEAKIALQNKEIYFKRTVLAAEIVNQLHDEITFGRVKFQKLVYLCEHASNMNVERRYSKFAAGPFDNKFMHSIVQEFERQKWFMTKKVTKGKYTKSVYSPASNVNNYKKYYRSYFNNDNDNIQFIISNLRHHKTDFVELVATLYACWLEILNDNRPVTQPEIFNVFYSWSKEKERFSKTEITQALSWMTEKGITPNQS